jgi:hypothetical protein
MGSEHKDFKGAEIECGRLPGYCADYNSGDVDVPESAIQVIDDAVIASM